MRKFFEKFIPHSKVLAGISLVFAIGVYAYSNRGDNTSLVDRCNQVVNERVKDEKDKDLARLLCNEPCYCSELVKMVDEYGMKIDNLEDAFGYVSVMCNKTEGENL